MIKTSRREFLGTSAGAFFIASANRTIDGRRNPAWLCPNCSGTSQYERDTSAALRMSESNGQNGSCRLLTQRNGHVARGVCETDENGYLTSITERTKIFADGENAKFIEKLTFTQMKEMKLKVIDEQATELLCDKDIDVRVFSMDDVNNFIRVANGETIGTILSR